MTIRKRFEVRRGDTVTVGLPVQPAVQSVKRKGEEGSRLVNPGEQEDDLYVFRKVGCKLYDTGTMLNAGNYLEIKDALVKPANDFGLTVVTQAMFDAFIVSLEAQYLDGIFDSTDSKPNKRALKFAAEQLWIDVIQTDIDFNEHKTVIGRDFVRPLLADSFANDSSALTAPLASNTDWSDSKGSSDDGNADGVLRVLSNIKGINIYAYGFFLDFDTLATARFKVTETNVMSDPEIIPDDLKDLVGIYLVPYNAGVAITGSGYERIFFQRLSPYNDYTFLLVTAENGISFPNAVHPTELLLHDTVINAPVNISDVPPGSTAMIWKNNVPFQLNYQWAGALRGVLKTKKKVYYVWLKPATNDTFGRPYEPSFINVGSIVSGIALF